MNKTLEQIKKGLEHCAVGRCGEECPYFTEIDLPFGHEQGCDDGLLPDALAYIQQLESNDSQVKKALSDNGFASLEAFLQAYNQVKAERDAAIKDIPRACAYCKHYVHKKTHLCRSKYPCAHVSGVNTRWEWRGVQEGGKIG